MFLFVLSTGDSGDGTEKVPVFVDFTFWWVIQTINR